MSKDIFEELFDETPIEREPTTEKSSTLYDNIHMRGDDDDDVIYWESDLRNVAYTYHYLITCSWNQSNTRVAMYELNDTKSSGSREVCAKCLRHIRLACDDHCSTRNTVSCLKHVCHSPKHGRNVLDFSIFHALFADESESSFSVLLVGLQNGKLGYTYVEKDYSDRINTSLKMLHHLEQKVSAVFLVRLGGVIPDTSPVADAICILGSLGKLVLIFRNVSDASTSLITFREYYLPGPIICATMNKSKNTIFYSTREKICKFRLDCIFQSGEDCSPHSVMTPKVFDIPKVYALSIDDDDSLTCLTTDGRVLLVALSSARHVEQPTNGKVIKTCLEDLHAKSAKLDKVLEENRLLDELIRELNTVTHILFDVLRNRKSVVSSCDGGLTATETGISFKVDVAYEVQGSSLNPKVVLRCRLTSSSRFPFSLHWSWIVKTHILEPWYNEDGCTRSTRSYSVCLSPSSVHHISITLDETFSYRTPIVLSNYLCCFVGDLIPSLLKEKQPKLGEQGFSVFICAKELDILSFLRRHEPILAGFPRWESPACLLQKTLNDFNGLPPSDLNEQEDTSKFHSFCIRLSKKAVDFIYDIHHPSSDVATFEEQTSSGKSNFPATNSDVIPPEAIVLHYILHGSSANLFSDDVRSVDGHVVARTPHEEVIKFQVIRRTPDMVNFEIRVHAASRELACSVHSALLKAWKVRN